MQPFELFAIRYARNGPRTLAQNMIGGDIHEMGSDLDYFVWVAKRSDRVFLIDTGMSAETAKRRRDEFARVPADAIRLLGLDPVKIEDIILTHLHYDHAGTLDRYPNARFYVQDSEMSYVTGRCMCSRLLRRGYEVDDVVHLVRSVFADKVAFADEHCVITDGLSVHRVGGHTGGSQVVRVWTRRGWVVLASDAAHLFLNVRKARAVSVGLPRRRDDGGIPNDPASRGWFVGSRDSRSRSARDAAVPRTVEGAPGDRRAARRPAEPAARLLRESPHAFIHAQGHKDSGRRI